MPSTRPHLAFVGMAGAGKSAIARRIAQAFGMPVLDVDAAVVEADGRSIPEIFAADGEGRFRELETAALRAALGSPTPTVIATGGGVVEAATNRELLALHARTVLLHATDEVLVERLRNSSNRRPLLEGDLEANLAALHQRRDGLYHEVAELIVEVGVLDVADTAELVAAAIIERWPQQWRRTEPKGCEP